MENPDLVNSTFGEINCQLVSRDDPETTLFAAFADVTCPDLSSLTQKYEKDIERYRKFARKEDTSPVKEALSDKADLSDSWKTRLGLLSEAAILQLKYWLPPAAKQMLGLLDYPRLSPQITRCIAWHPYKQHVAVAVCNDTISIYNVVLRKWCNVSLRHDFQQEIRAIEWKPYSGGTLAVACRNGICLWQMSAASNKTENFSCNWVRILKVDTGPVLAIAWSPCGNMLASASKNSNVVSIWSPHLASANTEMLPRDPLNIGWASNAQVLCWSPTGYYLFAGTSTDSLCVWETRTWCCEVWSSQGGVCKGASWSIDGRVLLLSIQGKKSVHGLIFDHSPPRIDARFIPFALKVDKSDADTHYELQNQRIEENGISEIIERESKINCGDILDCILDPTGERVAVIFQSSCRIGIYNANIAKGRMTFNPRKSIYGPFASARPVAIKWFSQCIRGALLCVAWDNGKMSFYPFYFDSIALSKPDANNLVWAGGAPVPSTFSAPHLSYRYQQAKSLLKNNN